VGKVKSVATEDVVLARVGVVVVVVGEGEACA